MQADTVKQQKKKYQFSLKREDIYNQGLKAFIEKVAHHPVQNVLACVNHRVCKAYNEAYKETHDLVVKANKEVREELGLEGLPPEKLAEKRTEAMELVEKKLATAMQDEVHFDFDKVISPQTIEQLALSPNDIENAGKFFDATVAKPQVPFSV